MDMSAMYLNIMSLFFIVFIGLVSGKTKLVDNTITGALSKILMSVTLPATIISSMQQPMEKELIYNSVLLFTISSIIYCISAVVIYFLTQICKVPTNKRGIWVHAGTFSNAGFMGFPILNALFGEIGLFYGSIVNLSFNLFCYTLGTGMIARSTNETSKIHIKHLLLTTMNISMIIGLLLFAFQIKLPAGLNQGISLLGSITSPLSMLVLGMVLSRSHFKSMFTDKGAYLLAAIRLLGAPVLILCLLLLLPLPTIVVQVLVAVAAMPAAIALSLVSEQYKANTEFAARVVFISSLFCGITIPFVLWTMETIM